MMNLEDSLQLELSFNGRYSDEVDDLEKKLSGLGLKIKRTPNLNVEYFNYPTYRIESYNKTINKSDFMRLALDPEFDKFSLIRRERFVKDDLSKIEFPSLELASNFVIKLKEKCQLKGKKLNFIELPYDSENDNIKNAMAFECDSVYALRLVHDCSLFSIPLLEFNRKKTYRSFLNHLRGDDSDEHLKGYSAIGSLI